LFSFSGVMCVAQTKDDTWWSRKRSELEEGFYSRLNAVPFGLYQQPADTVLNPNNSTTNASRYLLQCDLRPDFGLRLGLHEFVIKPRGSGSWRQWENGVDAGESMSTTDWYVNEWLARIAVRDDLLLSFGRENLQWGPSYLFSPSNPFNQDNGRDNTEIEQPGLDYARLVWLPAYEWTLSAIVNTGKGRFEPVTEFEPVYALKLDYNGDRRYLTGIVSKREEDDPRFGYYGGISLSRAWLLYSEGSASTYDHGKFLLGSSYTLAMGPTLSVEFFHNRNGCRSDEAFHCFPPFDELEISGKFVRDNYLLLQQFVDEDTMERLNRVRSEPFLRKNYVFFQYLDTDILDRFDVTLRWTLNLDDQSSRAVGIITMDVGDHVELFTVLTVNDGGDGSEFGSLLESSVMAGMSITL